MTRFAIFVAPFDELADPRVVAGLAARTEAAGWDGFFVWDHVSYRPPVVALSDCWTCLAAAAVATRRVRLGAMVTPLARRRPQVLARQLVALDQLSGGRMVLGAGLGLDSSGGELSRFGEETDDRRRAAMLDEALELLDALLRGERVDHDGARFAARDVRFLPVPLQDELPVWVAARWPHRRPLARAARHDGVFAIDLAGPADLIELRARLAEENPALRADFEIVVDAAPGADPVPWVEAGATWWCYRFGPFDLSRVDVERAIDAGPPIR